MVNQGFLARKEKRNIGTFNRNDLWTFGKYNVKADNVKHVAFLSDTVLYKNLHFTGTVKMAVCDEDYVDEFGNSLPCEACKQPSKNFPDQLNYPTEHLLALVCVFEDKDQMRVSKKGKEYPINWVQVLALPTHKKGIYVDKIEKAIDEGYLLDDIWEFRKNKDNELITPSPLSARDLKKLGDQFDTKCHLPLQREHIDKGQDVALSLILSAVSNVRYDNFELIKLGVKPLESDEESNDLDKD